MPTPCEGTYVAAGLHDRIDGHVHAGICWPACIDYKTVPASQLSLRPFAVRVERMAYSAGPKWCRLCWEDMQIEVWTSAAIAGSNTL